MNSLVAPLEIFPRNCHMINLNFQGLLYEKKRMQFSLFWVCYTGFYKYPPTVFWFSCSGNHWGVQFPTTLRSPHICVWFLFYWFGLVITTIIIIPFHHNFVQLFLIFFYSYFTVILCGCIYWNEMHTRENALKRFCVTFCHFLIVIFMLLFYSFLFWDRIFAV